MKAQRGMTLLELMIVVLILGIIAVIALPAYDDYTVRSQVADGLSVVAAAKTAVSETRISNGTFPSNNGQAGLPGTISSNWVDSVAVSNNGLITITFDTTTTSILPGEDTLEFNPSFTNGAVLWDCTGGSLIEKYRPGNCR